MLLVTDKTRAKHRVEIPADDGGPIVFKWHFPRGTFDARMSAKEIAPFLLGHMPAIVPLLSDHPRVAAEFQSMLVKLATSREEVLDEVLSWIQPMIRTESDDLIVLNIRERRVFTPPTVATFAGGF